jgi:hypothetical protein
MARYMDLTKTSSTSRLDDFYHNVDKNTIDVLCVGSSHMGSGINPVQMWDDYGISAYSIWGGSQAVWFSYYYLLEALKNRNESDVFKIQLHKV